MKKRTKENKGKVGRRWFLYSNTTSLRNEYLCENNLGGEENVEFKWKFRRRKLLGK